MLKFHWEDFQACLALFTLWQLNISIENRRFIGDFPITTHTHTMFHIYVRLLADKVFKLTTTIPSRPVLSVDQAARFQHQLNQQGVPGFPEKRPCWCGGCYSYGLKYQLQEKRGYRQNNGKGTDCGYEKWANVYQPML